MGRDVLPYARATEQLSEMLGWLRRLLAWQVEVTRQTYGALANDEYRGLYIPDAEAEILGSESAQLPDALVARRAALEAERAHIDERTDVSARDGATFPLRRVARLFGLASLDCDVLLLALAPEIDLRFERLYAYIQDDVTKRRPSVDLALRLLCKSADTRIASRAHFAADAPLIRHRLIHLFEDGQRQPPLLGRFIKLDDRLVSEMLGDRAESPPAIDALIAHATTLDHPRRSFSELALPSDVVTRLKQISADHPRRLVLGLHGTYGSGRRAIAEALCAEAGVPLLTANLERLVHGDTAGIEGSLPSVGAREAIGRVVREATLRDAAVLWQGVDPILSNEDAATWREALLHALDEFDGRSFLVLHNRWEAHSLLRRASYLLVELGPLSFAEREQVWRARLNGDGPDVSTLQAIASTFRLTGGQIRDAATMAKSVARWRAAGAGPTVEPRVQRNDLYAACRAQSSGKLSSLAHKIATTYGWDDIVLPRDHVEQLREICVQVRHRRTVLEEWGFDRHLSMGKGVNVLFAGQSGTGKTMAAEIVASDLGLELFKVDLSTMVSKYIGETEKNLDKVFTAAREANAILFFDEADALFGKRSEVKDAHDRYANIEVGYLLQKMEEYEGVVILSTNLRKNLDDAFIRRLHMAVEFPFPEPSDRLRIWRKVFPSSVPIDDDVDLDFLAQQFKLAGGNIRNIALLSAYLAAEDGTAIGMSHLVRAIKREYQKLGKLLTENEFGAYLPIVREAVAR
jgi:AAA+ superfamily predicted ATPase